MHENSTPHEILRWAGETFGDDLVVTASFGDAVLAHLANSVLPGVDIVLLDTGYLFAETEWYADDLRRRFGLNLRTVHPLPDVERDVWQTDTDACCAARKVEPLQRALAGKRAWVTGLAPGRLAEPGHARPSCTTTCSVPSPRSTRSPRGPTTTSPPTPRCTSSRPIR